jgi:mRNA interferase RelE/StbE
MPKPGAADSSEFRIFETAEFSRSLARLSAHDAQVIRKKLVEFAYPQFREMPFFGPNIKKLRGYAPDTWRFRIGRFRVFYTVDPAERIVYILTAEARKDAYR